MSPASPAGAGTGLTLGSWETSVALHSKAPRSQKDTPHGRSQRGSHWLRPETGVTVLRRLSVLPQRLRPRPTDSPGPGTHEHVGPSPGASPSSRVCVLGLRAREEARPGAPALPQASAGSCGNPGSCAGARLSASLPLRGTHHTLPSEHETRNALKTSLCVALGDGRRSRALHPF